MSGTGKINEAKKRAVVVDDDNINLYYVGKILRDRAYTVINARTYYDALKALSEKTCDLLLVDIRLGKASGLQLARLALARQPKIKVLLMTAYRDEELRAGDTGLPLIRVPFTSQDLLVTVERLLA